MRCGRDEGTTELALRVRLGFGLGLWLEIRFRKVVGIRFSLRIGIKTKWPP